MTKPFIKCAGGKRLLADTIIEHMPERIGTYCEPFLGGGAVFFRLQETGRLKNARVVLGEFDPDLVRLWRAVQNDPRTLHLAVKVLCRKYAIDAEATYYGERDKWNKGNRTPARNMFLRYAGYNGLWRVNKSGGMNVPWGKYDEPNVPNFDKLQEVQAALQNVEFLAGDYRATVDAAADHENRNGDWDNPRWYEDVVTYFDPPYDDGFVAYTEYGFSDLDHRNLLLKANELCNKGGTVLYTNAATDRVRGWVQHHWSTATIHAITGKRTIAPTADARGDAKELLVVQ